MSPRVCRRDPGERVKVAGSGYDRPPSPKTRMTGCRGTPSPNDSTRPVPGRGAAREPQRRAGIAEALLTTARGVPYVMLRSHEVSDGTGACYLHLTPDELALTRLMDGTRTVAQLVTDFSRIRGRFAPDQVLRLVADLAGNQMLEDQTPADTVVDGAADPDCERRRPRPARWPVRLGRWLALTARGRRTMWLPGYGLTDGCSS